MLAFFRPSIICSRHLPSGERYFTSHVLLSISSRYFVVVMSSPQCWLNADTDGADGGSASNQHCGNVQHLGCCLPFQECSKCKKRILLYVQSLIFSLKTSRQVIYVNKASIMLVISMKKKRTEENLFISPNTIKYKIKLNVQKTVRRS